MDLGVSVQMSWQDKITCTHWNSEVICCGNRATAFGHCTKLFPFSTGSVHCKSIPDSAVLKLHLFVSQNHLTPTVQSYFFQTTTTGLTLACITYTTDLTYFKLSYTLFISPPSPCINCVCFPSLPLTSQRWEQLRHCCYPHLLPPSLETWGQPSPPSLCWGQGSQFL